MCQKLNCPQLIDFQLCGGYIEKFTNHPPNLLAPPPDNHPHFKLELVSPSQICPDIEKKNVCFNFYSISNRTQNMKKRKFHSQNTKWVSFVLNSFDFS